MRRIRRFFIFAAMVSSFSAWGAPWLVAQPTYLEFGAVPPGYLASNNFQLNNWGNEPAPGISVFTYCGPGFTVQSLCFADLQPNFSCPVTVRFQAQQPGEYNCSIDVYSIGSGSVRVNAHATVTAP
jgi:hypothetical protein